MDATQDDLIAERVIDAKEKMRKGQHLLALDAVCHAVAATARNEYGDQSAGDAARFKRFIKDNMEIITRGMSCGILGVMGTLRLPNVFQSVRGIKDPSLQDYVDLEDIVYSVVRCCLTHESKLPSGLSFNEKHQLSTGHAQISLPIDLVYGLMFAVMAAPSNAGHTSGAGLSLNSPSGVSVPLPELWGQSERIRKLLVP